MRRSREPLKSLMAMGLEEVYAEAIIEHMRWDASAPLDPLKNPGDAQVIISLVKKFVDGGSRCRSACSKWWGSTGERLETPPAS